MAAMHTQAAADASDPIVALAQAGAADRAAEAAIRGYGQEIYGFLVATLRGEAEADEVFSMWGEDVWKGIGRFAGRSSLRTWLYVLARHAVARHHRGDRRRMAELDGNSKVERVAAEVRTSTAEFLRTEARDRFAELRRALPEDDQVLLVLRVNRGLEWAEIARAMLDEDEPDASALRREAARLRKRFERLRALLVERGREAGLVVERSASPRR